MYYVYTEDQVQPLCNVIERINDHKCATQRLCEFHAIMFVRRDISKTPQKVADRRSRHANSTKIFVFATSSHKSSSKATWLCMKLPRE